MPFRSASACSSPVAAGLSVVFVTGKPILAEPPNHYLSNGDRNIGPNINRIAMPRPTNRGIGMGRMSQALAVQYSTCFALTSGLRYLIKYQIPMLSIKIPGTKPKMPPGRRSVFIVKESTPSVTHNIPAVRGRLG